MALTRSAYIDNNNTYLWRTDLHVPQFLLGVGMDACINTSWKTGQWRLVLSADHVDYTSFRPGKYLQEFPVGCTLELRKNEGRDQHSFNDSALISRFERCVPDRATINKVVISSPSDIMILRTILEVDCHGEWISEI